MALLRSSIRQIPGDLKIELTEVENQLCVFLDECCADLKETKGLVTSCRIAGGWVRDKVQQPTDYCPSVLRFLRAVDLFIHCSVWQLLGMQSNDIDIALTDMMGEDFAHHLAEFAKSKDVKTGALAIFNPNPEQSKHLQTARIPIFGLDLDLVNLRSEEYADNSRIPTAVVQTKLHYCCFSLGLDALVRHSAPHFKTPCGGTSQLTRFSTTFTLVRSKTALKRSSLPIPFPVPYLFSSQGLEDLKSGTIRTPLPPRETFIDDPLRILRSLRFASRFGFEIVPELAEAVLDPAIKVNSGDFEKLFHSPLASMYWSQRSNENE
jgi:tRNA nucleotidyltransferase (CCA-adding enzyme)